MELTKNFKLSEFECRCGCDMPENIKAEITDLAHNLQKLRDAVGKPIAVVSGYRCPRHNEIIGGAKNSMHMAGKAVDIVVAGFSPSEVETKIEGLIEKKEMREGGIGIYSTFTHYDGRGVKVRW